MCPWLPNDNGPKEPLVFFHQTDLSINQKVGTEPPWHLDFLKKLLYINKTFCNLSEMTSLTTFHQVYLFPPASTFCGFCSTVLFSLLFPFFKKPTRQDASWLLFVNCNIRPSVMSINYPNPRIRNGKYLAGGLPFISNSMPTAHVGWELTLNMKCTCCPCPNLSCSRIFNSGFMLESMGECSKTDCWALPQSFWKNSRSQGRAWESASLTSSQVRLPLVWGPRFEIHWSDVQSGHWDFKKQTKWFQCVATVEIHFHILLLLSCSEKTTGCYLLKNEL